MATATKQMNVTAGNSTATVQATVNDNMPGIACPDPAGYRYVGARYVPKFAEPIDWNNATTYEPLTIVTYQGNSYTSKQFVPTGVEITNTDYWAPTGNYDAQVEQYRQEVQRVQQSLDSIFYMVTPEMSVEEIQTALNTYSNVLFTPGIYEVGNTSPVFKVNPNQHIKFDDATIRTGVFTSDYYSILDCRTATDFVIEGSGTIIGDADEHDITDENDLQGFGINLSGADHFRISGLTITKCFGDGIYISGLNKNGGKNGLIENCIIANNNRQGMSIESCYNILVDNCEIYGSMKTPGCGIDIEPYDSTQIIEGLTINGCRIHDNSQGINIYNPVNVKIECEISGCVCDKALNISDTSRVSAIFIHDCRFKNAGTHAFRLAGVYGVSVERVLFDCTGLTGISPIIIGNSLSQFAFTTWTNCTTRGIRLMNIPDTVTHLISYDVANNQGANNFIIDIAYLQTTKLDLAVSTNANPSNTITTNNNVVKMANPIIKTLSENATDLNPLYLYIINGGTDFQPVFSNVYGEIAVYNNTEGNISINTLGSVNPTNSHTLILASGRCAILKKINYVNQWIAVSE